MLNTKKKVPLELIRIYKERCQSESLNSDQKQIQILERFTVLERHIKKRRIPFISRPSVIGMYLYGSVGSGKSMLMDLFYNNISGVKKQRIHFHNFMEYIHNEIHILRQSKVVLKSSPLKYIAKKLSKRTTLLCFDEFQVHDVADALILGQLFSYLFKYNVFVIATSNRHLDDLYKGGIQREKFIEFVELFKSKLEILQLSGDTDYRQVASLSLNKTYYFPDNQTNTNIVYNYFRKITANSLTTKKSISHKGRIIEIASASSKTAMMPFSDIFDKALNSSDYQIISLQFETIFLVDVRSITPDENDIAKRFINFIDICYENKIELIILASCSEAELYCKGKLLFEFERTLSRLNEMQSSRYQKK